MDQALNVLRLIPCLSGLKDDDLDVVILLPAEEFKKMLSKDLSGIGVKIISSLCLRVRYLSDLLENITFKDVEKRIILCLLKLINANSMSYDGY